MDDLTISIVAYHNGEMIIKAIESIEQYTDKNLKKHIYVIDNGGTPEEFSDILEKYPDMIYRNPGRNIGFGSGHNLVLPLLDSQYHAIVNPDILLMEDSFSKLLDFMKRERVRMCIPKIIDENGNLQYSCRNEITLCDMAVRRLPGRVFDQRRKKHTLQDHDYKSPFPVPFAQGSFLIMETKLLKCVNGFDERYFMYMEDADLCKKVNGITPIIYCPETSVIHKWEKGSHKNMWLFFIHLESMIRYYKKWGLKLR